MHIRLTQDDLCKKIPDRSNHGLRPLLRHSAMSRRRVIGQTTTQMNRCSMLVHSGPLSPMEERGRVAWCNLWIGMGGLMSSVMVSTDVFVITNLTRAWDSVGLNCTTSAIDTLYLPKNSGKYISKFIYMGDRDQREFLIPGILARISFIFLARPWDFIL